VSDTTTESSQIPLNVNADLTVSVDGGTAEVSSTGDRLFVTFPSILPAVNALRGLPSDPDSADTVAAVLSRTDLTIEVRVHDRTVAVIGSKANPGTLSEALSADPIEVRLGGVIGAVTRELSDAVERVRQLVR
jgi:hypothetical protein